MAEDDTQRFFESVDLSQSSDVSVSFAQLDSAEDFENMADSLKAAAEHCHVAAQHMIKGRVPRGCAHGFAVQGHVHQALRIMERVTIRHAEYAHLDDDDGQGNGDG